MKVPPSDIASGMPSRITSEIPPEISAVIFREILLVIPAQNIPEIPPVARLEFPSEIYLQTSRGFARGIPLIISGTSSGIFQKLL